MTIPITPIASVRSPFKQRFSIPRQPNLAPAAEGIIVFKEEFKDPNYLRELEQFSHLWLIFIFHAVAGKGWATTVQPPRLGGKERVGVFASRSPFRPNPIGISVVTNLGVNTEGSETGVRVGGLDLLDGTPIVDIKPYIPYADSIPGASAGFATTPPDADLAIQFTEIAESQLGKIEPNYPNLRDLITQVLRQDPRPAWRVKESDDKCYGMDLYEFNIKWKFIDGDIHVLTVL